VIGFRNKEPIMFTVNTPESMNETFARAFNSRQLQNLLALYEEEAVLCDAAQKTVRGKARIAAELEHFLRVPGTLVGRNNFCLRHGNVALLRADWTLLGPDNTPQMSGSSAEIVRQQPDGTWLYIVDHAVGSSLPRVG
jgi:ketosteroid isomerase-like protein